jgi:hypothetical protein
VNERDCAEIRHPDTPCSKPKSCRNCENQGHDGSFDKKCSKFKSEQIIVKMKIDQDISFGKARELYEESVNSKMQQQAAKIMKEIETAAEIQAQSLEAIIKRRNEFNKEADQLEQENIEMQQALERLMNAKRTNEMLKQNLATMQAQNHPNEVLAEQTPVPMIFDTTDRTKRSIEGTSKNPLPKGRKIQDKDNESSRKSMKPTEIEETSSEDDQNQTKYTKQKNDVAITPDTYDELPTGAQDHIKNCYNSIDFSTSQTPLFVMRNNKIEICETKTKKQQTSAQELYFHIASKHILDIRLQTP